MNKITTLLITLLFFGFKAHAQMHSGLTIQTIYSEDRGKNIEIYYWYPTEEARYDHEFGNNRIFASIKATRDAKIYPGKHPVIALAHGGMRSSFTHSGWIAAALSKQGYIVVTPKPPQHNEIPPSQAVNELWLRPSDVRLGLSHLDNIPLLSQNADRDNIAGVGFFLGGTTMLTLAGGKISPDKYKASCKQNGVNIDCPWLLKNKVDLDNLTNNLFDKVQVDPRITSIVVINPELTKTLDTQSLADINSRTTLINLSANTNPTLEPAKAMMSIPKLQTIEIASATPFSAFSLCTEKGVKILSLEGEDEICHEIPNTARQDNHQRIVEEILEALGLLHDAKHFGEPSDFKDNGREGS